MNNDLISREALKKALHNFFDGKVIAEPTYILRDFFCYIDSAPTVFNCNACKNMGNERECVDCHDYSNYVHYADRPQGEWKERTDERWGGTTIYCPYCKENALEKYRDGLYRQVKSNFCSNCGAKLEKGGVK